jgi:hypothetical protein
LWLTCQCGLPDDCRFHNTKRVWPPRRRARLRARRRRARRAAIVIAMP